MAEVAYDELVDAFSNPGGQWAGDSKLFARFFLHPVIDEELSTAQGRPVFRETEYVEIIVPGDKDNTICRPVRTSPVSDIRRFPRQYAQFKEGVEQAAVGTPLSAWPGVTRAQVEELKYFKVTTVEQLAGMADSVAQNFAGIVALKVRAKDYLARASGEAVDVKLQAIVSEKDSQIAQLQATLSKMTESLTALEKRMDDKPKK
jgi:hypothetical protein